MIRDFLLFPWIMATLIHAVLCLPDFRRSQRTSAVTTIAAGCGPFICLALFIVVFVVGGSFNIAQLAGASGSFYWRLWFAVWPLFVLLCPLSVLGQFVAVMLPPYGFPMRSHFVGRLCGLGAAVASCYFVFTYFPDA